IVCDDAGGAERSLLIQLLPPFVTRLDMVNYTTEICEIGEIVISPGRDKRTEADCQEDQKDRQRVAERLTKDGRKIVKIKIEYCPQSLRFCAVDHPMGFYDEVVQIAYQPPVARFDARNRQVRCGATIAATKLAHLVSRQPFQTAHTLRLRDQLFQPLPARFATFNKIVSHRIS